MNKYDISNSDKAENVTQIRFLKINFLSGSAFFVGAPARSNDNDLLPSEQSLGAVWPIRNRLPDSHNLVDPCLEQGGDREVVHGCSNDDRIRRLYLPD